MFRSWGGVMRFLSRIGLGAICAALLLLSVSAPTGAITNGSDATSSSYDNIGSLWTSVTTASTGTEYFFICSGIFVTPTDFLTASHCIAQTEAYAARYGISNVVFHISLSPSFGGCTPNAPCSQPPCSPKFPCTSPPKSWISVSGVYLNPAYSLGQGGGNGTYVGDVSALTVAKTPSKLGNFTNFPTDPTPDYLGLLSADQTLSQSSTFSVFGMGSGVREVGILSFNSLTNDFVYESQVSTQTDPSAGACYGDSGGPNMLNPLGQNPVLVALTSTGDTNCNATNVSSRLDTPDVQAFLATVPGLASWLSRQ